MARRPPAGGATGAPPHGGLAGWLPADWAAWFRAQGEPAFRARQAFHALTVEGRLDPRTVHTLPAALRERLWDLQPAPATAVVEVQTSADGTGKWLLALADGRRVETVLIPERSRRTVCISTQVGCPMGCVFCASGVGGLVRNLTPAEIVEQLIRVQAHLGGRASHVVLMGMGEPLLNLDAVAQAIRVWTAPEGLAFSPRRITVSTAATPAGIERLAALRLGVQLAISLHAPDDLARGRLVPGSPAGRTAALVAAGARYARATGRDVTLEYVLIAGENDAPEQAEALAALAAGGHLHVNLIPLNPVGHRPDLRAPSGLMARAFLGRLRARGVAATLRTRRGEDIAAACGQLALERALR